MRLLRETPRSERRPVRVLEGTIHDYRDQICRHLQNRGLHRQAAMFALPNPLPDTIQWYTDLDGPIRALTGLGPEEQAPAASETATLVESVERESTRLLSERDTGAQTLSRLLASALEGGGLADVMLVGDQPVLAGWGMRPVDALSDPIGGATRDLLGQLRTVSRPVPIVQPLPPPGGVPPPLVPPSRVTLYLLQRRWPLRLLGIAVAVLLLASLVAWLLPGLVPTAIAAFRLPLAPSCGIVQSQGAGLLPLQEEEARLRGRVADLEREAGRRRQQQCGIAAAPPVPPAGPSGPAPSVDARLQEAHARAGKVQVSLEWNSLVDLDLHVLCPDGQQIDFNHKQGCGGELDVDMNASVAHMSPTPVEHVIWDDQPPSGTYRVFVHYFDYTRQQTPMPFNVYVEINGQRRKVSGVVNENVPQLVTEFTIP
jgi:hypothetical protein